MQKDQNASLPIRVALISRVSHQAAGGTAAYIRFLGQWLQRKGNQVRGVARLRAINLPNTSYHENDPSPKRLLPPDGPYDFPVQLIESAVQNRLVLARLATLLSRPALHTTGISLFNHALAKPFADALSPETDVIHYTGNGWEMLGFTALAEARRRGIPFTVMPFVHPETWGDSPLDTRLYNEADAVFVCSEYERNHLIAKGVRYDVLKRTGLAPASISIGKGMEFRAAHGLGNRPLLLFIGRKERYKGYHAVCAAMKVVQREVPDVCLVAIGLEAEPPFPVVPPGALLDLGVVGDQEKADALAACDLFCMPSVAESFGIVYVEAWTNHKPVIGGTAPAVRELIEEGVNGYCVTQEPSEIADAVILLLRDPQLRQRVGAAGYAVQQSLYNWERVAKTHEKVFRQLCDTTAAQ